MSISKTKLKENRQKRVRKKIIQNTDRPRLNVFRSNKHIYAQIIDDNKGITLAAAQENEIFKSSQKKVKGSQKLDKEKSDKKNIKLSKLEKASLVGQKIAEKAKKIKKTRVTFDRGSYRYHGRIKALAESARKNGLIF